MTDVVTVVLPEGWSIEWGNPGPWSGTIRKDGMPIEGDPTHEVIQAIGGALLKNGFHVRHFKGAHFFYGSVEGPEQRKILDEEFINLARDKVNDYEPTSPFSIHNDASVELQPDGSARVCAWIEIEPPCPECGKETICGDLTCPDGCTDEEG